MKRQLIVAASTLFLSGLGIVFLGQVPAHALAVSPPQYDYSLEPGSTITGEFEVINNDDRAANFLLKAVNVDYEGETAQPRFNFQETPEAGSAATWVTTSTDRLAMTGNTIQKVSFTITVPANAPVGTHAITLFVSDTEGEIGSDAAVVGTNRLIGVSMFMNIAGEVTQRPQFIDFRLVDSLNIFGLQILDTFPSTFETRLSNSGNTAYRPSGTVILRDGARNEPAIRDMRLNSAENRVLPGKTRLFSVSYTQNQEAYDAYKQTPNVFTFVINYLTNLTVGSYNAELSIDPRLRTGQQNQVIGKQINFIVFPWRLVLVLLALVVLFVIYGKLKQKIQSRRVRGAARKQIV